MSDHPLRKGTLPVSSLNLPTCSFEPFPRALSLGTERRDPHPALHFPSSESWRDPRPPFILQSRQPQSLSCSSQPFNPHTILADLLWTHSGTFTSSLNYGPRTPESIQGFPCLCLLGLCSTQRVDNRK